MAAVLGRKQTLADQAAWQAAIAAARQTVPDAELDALIDQTVSRIEAAARDGEVAYAWSGGKDSQVLRWCMERAGVDRAVIGMTTGLEWPAMLRWITDHLPPGCDVHAEPLDLPWLVNHPEMLFPKGRNGSRWFSLVQHRAQRAYFKTNRLGLLALGRRRRDGNYISPDPDGDRYTDRHGTVRWSPIADWTHEQVFRLIDREQIPMPPCYGWPRGYQVGTGPWPARQWTQGLDHGFEECWQIDAGVIRAAAADLPEAASWMERTGRT
jgi:3'-phosphoadenosine 5'-phosphosulfate sulfotransferase (PAPS reductase)/FAD synthetase